MNLQNLLIIAAVIHVVMRLLKTGKLDGRIPARWRPVVALGLGGIAVAIQALANGVPWRQALLEGILGASAAMATHDVGVESIFGGNEFMGKAKPVVAKAVVVSISEKSKRASTVDDDSSPHVVIKEDEAEEIEPPSTLDDGPRAA